MTIAVLAYIVYLILFAVINLAVFYHIKKYRYPGDVSGLVAVIFLAVVVTIILSTFATLGII